MGIEPGSAVDNQIVARYIGSCGREQIENGPGDLFTLAQAFERN